MMSRKMNADTNTLNWFEIAVNDLDRARKFYEVTFQVTLTPWEMPEGMPMKMVMFPTDGSNGTVGGALVKSGMHTPGAAGTIVYLNANPDLQLIVDRIEKAGGKVMMPKTLINEQAGYMAIFADTEGNTIGLHSIH